MFDLSDAALAVRAKRGDRNALDALISRHYDTVWRYIRAKTGDTELAYDLTQEVFIRVCANLDSYSERSAFAHYLLRIAHNLCVDRFRAARPPALPEDSAAAAAAPGDAFAEYAERDAVYNALARLPDEQREVVTLRFISGMKLREIADIQGVPLATAKSRLRAGSERLKALLKEEGLT